MLPVLDVANLPVLVEVSELWFKILCLLFSCCDYINRLVDVYFVWTFGVFTYFVWTFGVFTYLW